MPLRLTDKRCGQPTAAVLDSRTVQSTPQSGGGVGCDGHKRCQGSKLHVAVGTVCQLLTLLVTLTCEQNRAQAEALAAQVQQAQA